MASVMAVRASFAEAVHPLGPMAECKAHDRCVICFRCAWTRQWMDEEWID